jgi:hypothetical protein
MRWDLPNRSEIMSLCYLGNSRAPVAWRLRLWRIVLRRRQAELPGHREAPAVLWLGRKAADYPGGW